MESAGAEAGPFAPASVAIRGGSARAGGHYRACSLWSVLRSDWRARRRRVLYVGRPHPGRIGSACVPARELSVVAFGRRVRVAARAAGGGATSGVPSDPADRRTFVPAHDRCGASSRAHRPRDHAARRGRHRRAFRGPVRRAVGGAPSTRPQGARDSHRPGPPPQAHVESVRCRRVARADRDRRVPVDAGSLSKRPRERGSRGGHRAARNRGEAGNVLTT